MIQIKRDLAAIIETNKRMVGKRIKINDSEGEWFGTILGVKDADSFYVKPDNAKGSFPVDIFNVVQTY